MAVLHAEGKQKVLQKEEERARTVAGGGVDEGPEKTDKAASQATQKEQSQVITPHQCLSNEPSN